MLKFVILSSNKENIKEVEYIIDKKLFKNKEYYKYYRFEDSDENFERLLKSKEYVHCYIIDTDGVNTEKLINKIRIEYKDLSTSIIIIDKNNKLNLENILNKYYMNTFLIKDKNKIIEGINKIISSILILHNNKKTLNFNYNNIWYKLPYEEILYIEKEQNKKQCKIICKNDTLITKYSITELVNILNSDFIQTHRSAIVNKNNILKYDNDLNTIHFINEETTSLISRNKKNEIKEMFTV